MNNQDFWADINSIIKGGFTANGLTKLESYAEQFISKRLVYQRFSQGEQLGCIAGGATNVIASLLAGAENQANRDAEKGIGDFKREVERGKAQAAIIKQWAKTVGCWTDNADDSLSQALGPHIAEGGEAKVYDNGTYLVKAIGLDYFVQPILALDRISLHNALFQQTAMKVIGFGSTKNRDFNILVEQRYVEGSHISDDEISSYIQKLGFKLINPKNWTFATPEIYLSDLHDENVIRSKEGNIFVVDCDIRINTPELKCGGVRTLTTEVEFI